MVWRGVMAAFLQDQTRLIDLEGAFRSSKTTACLRKVAKSCVQHPGIHWWVNRFSDGDTQRQLKPQWRAMCDRMGIVPKWDAMEQADLLENGSKIYLFGVKTQDQAARYSKIRGLTLSGIYNDQSEELPHDVFLEFNGRLSQAGFPHQLLLSPNPPGENSWIARTEFHAGVRLKDYGPQGGFISRVIDAEGHPIDGRHYYSVPIYANAHNLPSDTIDELVRAYPPSHTKHRSAVLGLRGLNVTGDPVYKGAFTPVQHVAAVAFNKALPLDEAIDFGRHHPCVVWRQTSELGQIRYLGGLLGQNLYLEDFIPMLLHYRREWFDPVEVRTCCDPSGATGNTGIEHGAIEILRKAGIHATWWDDANRPDVRLTMIERTAGHMRRRIAPHMEAFVVNPTHWRRVSMREAVDDTFLADGFEAGYVWDEHETSVNRKPMRKPKKDGWYDHGQNCQEYLELHFGNERPPDKRVESVTIEMPTGQHAWMGA